MMVDARIYISRCSPRISVDDVILSLFVKIDHFIVNFWQNVLN